MAIIAAGAVVAFAGAGIGGAQVASRRDKRDPAVGDLQRRLAALEAAPQADGRVAVLGQKVDQLSHVLDAKASGVTVLGRAPLAQSPDGAELQFQIGVQRKTIGDALDAARSHVWGVQGALRAAGIPDSRMRVRWNDASQWDPNVGFNVSAIVYAPLDDEKKAAALIASATKGRAAEVHPRIEFQVEPSAAAMRTARNAAVADARAAAQEYARVLGKKLGTVLSMTEVSGEYPQPLLAPAQGNGYGSSRPELLVAVTFAFA